MMFGYIGNRSDVFNGIMAANIFPSLADVLTENLDSDEFGPLDLSLTSMAGASVFSKGLDENDFMNQNVLYDKEIKEEPRMHELSQPDDLLIHLPMWTETSSSYLSNFDENNEVGLVECEVEIGQGASPPGGYPRSPGSTGDNDYSSDSSFEHHRSIDDKRMITLERVQIPANMDRDIKPDLFQLQQLQTQKKIFSNIKPEVPSNLPDPSIIPPFFHDQNPDEEDDDQSMTDSGSESGDSKESEGSRKRPGRKKGQTSSVYHLWEFIRDLLHDPQYCPRIIKWESEEEGIFRVVNSTEVAKQWGSKKKNRAKMTYEKLSRSLRYSRKEGYFADIPKDKGYPKKLCFKFGPKSHGWRK